MPFQESHSHGIGGIILLREKGNLTRFQSSDVNQRIDSCLRFLVVASPEIDDVAVGWGIAQDRSARKGSEEQRFFFSGQRNRHDSCRGATLPIIARTPSFSINCRVLM